MKHLSFRFVCSLVSMILLLSLVTCFAESNDENSITDCITEITGIQPIITVQLDSTVEACAQYMLFPNYILAGPGGDKAELEKYLHPDLDTWDKNELWSIYGSIVQYLYEHSSEVLADGFRLSSGDSVNTYVMLGLYSDDYIYISFYNLVGDIISTSIIENK